MFDVIFLDLHGSLKYFWLNRKWILTHDSVVSSQRKESLCERFFFFFPALLFFNESWISITLGYKQYNGQVFFLFQRYI